MNTFYSIITATINPLTNESIALGLLLSDGSQSRYDFSANRLSLVKSLVAFEQYRFIKDYLRSFNTIIEKFDQNRIPEPGLNELKENLIINEPYVQYMSVYGQNVIKVSSPVRIDLEINEANFRKLFIKFIDKQEEPKVRTKKSIFQIKDDFSESVADYFTAERELPINEFPGLGLPVRVDLFGKNDQIVIVQFVDLERQINYIKTDFYDLEHINHSIEKKKMFLVTQEPNKKTFPQQHHLWTQTRKAGKYDYTDLQDVNRIQEYAIEHGVIPN
jgi:hypothetical protein